jgi:hypothetical protein
VAAAPDRPNEERMMTTKLKERQETPEERTGPGDYFLVMTDCGTWYVSQQTAASIGRVLDRWIRPRWLKFQDLTGSRAWVRTASVDCVTESTERQRTENREFFYLMQKESRANRRWDMDEE